MKTYFICFFHLLFIFMFSPQIAAEDILKENSLRDFVPNILTYEMKGVQIPDSQIPSFRTLISKLDSQRHFDWVPEALGKSGDKNAIPILKKEFDKQNVISNKIRISIGLILLGELEYYDTIMRGLKAKIPQYPTWIKNNGIPLNPISAAAAAAVKISAYGHKLPPNIIDELICLLDHPDNIVQNHARIALSQTTKNQFFLWAKKGNRLDNIYQVPKSERKAAKKMLQAAWLKWWKANKENYIKEKAYTTNGIKVKAAIKNQLMVELLIENVSNKNIRLLVEKTGKLKKANNPSVPWTQSLSVLWNKGRFSPAYPGISPRLESIPPNYKGRLKSISPDYKERYTEWCDLKPGQKYVYSFKLDKIFPNFIKEFKKGNTSKFAVSYRREWPVNGESWIGEVSSEFIDLKSP